MLKLTNAHVWKYKSIEDSSPVEIAKDVTVLVGKNESGKTAFLEALHKSLPFGRSGFDPVFDFPKKDYISYRPQHDAKNYAKVVQLTFAISADLAQRINRDVFGGELVLPEGHLFTRDTNYGNGNLIELAINPSTALVALKKPLKSVEFADEVFSGAGNLDEVLTRIDGKQLPADSTLAVFAKEWRSRTEKMTAGWDLIRWHIWSAYLSNELPRFLYFDDYRLLEGKVNLDSLNQRNTNKQLSEHDETVLGLFELAGITLNELMSDEGYETSKAKLEAIGLTITHQVFEYWKQNQDTPGNPTLAVEFDVKADPKDQAPFNSGKNLYIRVKNLKHGVTVPFDQRSKGFIWFFSFMVWFSAIENRLGTNKAVVLLLDEPGLSLHALAQKDFLGYIDLLSQSRQILYTTHSPFMVESDRLNRVRVVEDLPKTGTRVSGDLQGSGEDSLFPLQAALGYSVAQNLFIAKKNVLVEGPADLILLQHLSSLLEEVGKKGLADGVIVPAGGLDKVATFIALLGANKLQIAVLHDRSSKPHQGLEGLIKQKLIEQKRVLDYSLFRVSGNQETDIEDLFPETLYVEAFNAAYEKELGNSTATVGSLPKHPRIVERINQWLKTEKISLLRDGGFNHYRVAQALLPKLTPSSLGAQEIDSFAKLFEKLNKALS
ncbi:MAG TPA: AAA family ATPase [Terracidiphilus sp.]|jgi:hypothetical protein